MAKSDLKPEWRRLLNVLSDGHWYTRAWFPPANKSIPESVVKACIAQRLVKMKRKTRRDPQSYRIMIRITSRGKKALKNGWYKP